MYCAPLVGKPPITRLQPDIDYFPQFFTAVEGPQGQILVGGVDGVLAFDGARWRKIDVAGLNAVRSLLTVQERTYVGGFGRMGYLELSSAGVLTYTDLTPQATAHLENPAIKDIWDIFAGLDGRIYFRALRDLFIFDPETKGFSHQHHTDRFGAIFEYDSEVWLQFRGEGFRVMRNGQWQPLPETREYSEFVFDVVSRPDGSLLGIGFDGRWMQIPAAANVDYTTILGPASEYNRLIPLEDGGTMLGTTSGELVYLSSDNQVQRFDVAWDWIADLQFSRAGWLLVTLSGGAVLALDWPPRWSIVGDESDLRGAVYGVRHLDNRTLILGSGGIFEATAMEGETELVQLPWTQYEAWDAVEHESGLLFAESFRLLGVTDQEVVPLSDTDLYPRILQPSRLRPGWVWIGTETGLAVFNAESGVRHLGMRDFSISAIVETHDAVWIATADNGIFQVTPAADFERIESVREVSPPSGGVSATSLQWLDNRLIASTAGGIFEHKDDDWQPVTLYGLDSELDPGELVMLERGPDGDLWAVSDTQIRVLPGGTDQWRRLPTGAIRAGVFQSIDFPFSSSPYFGTSRSLVRFHPDRDRTEPGHALHLTQITRTSTDGQETKLDLNIHQHSVAAEDGITFGYALLDLADPSAVRYQARLRGYESRFTDWEATSSYFYGGLPTGEYVFEVRGRDSFGNQYSAQSPVIIIVPPWYETRWFRSLAIFVVTGLSFILGLVLMAGRHSRVRRRNAELERAVDERTSDLARANRRLEVLANQDGLTGLANRRQFDAFLEQSLKSSHTSLIMVDIDHFKRFNDTQGHLMGDELLQNFAGFLHQELSRKTDDYLVARYGGEEFAIVLPGRHLTAALTLAGDLKSSWAQQPTISIGVASAAAGGVPQELIGNADAALYAAKSKGRDRVCSA